jgi:hypothetical protein
MIDIPEPDWGRPGGAPSRISSASSGHSWGALDCAPARDEGCESQASASRQAAQAEAERGEAPA